MKYAADLRQSAREALQGKWPLAILVGLVAALLGGAASDGPEFKINYSGGELDANLQTIYSYRTVQGHDGRKPLAAVLSAIQLHRVEHSLRADAGPWQPCSAPLHGGRRGGILP